MQKYQIDILSKDKSTLRKILCQKVIHPKVSLHKVIFVAYIFPVMGDYFVETCHANTKQ